MKTVLKSSINAFLLIFLILAVNVNLFCDSLPGTKPLHWEGDLAARMVEGIDRYLMRAIDETREQRDQIWDYDFSSAEAYQQSIQPNRERLKKRLGIVDAREDVQLEFVHPSASPFALDQIPKSLVGSTDGYRIYAVRWNVFDGVEGEGLLIEPKSEAIANVIALPDCDWTPEMLAGLQEGISPESKFVRRLAEQGCRVIVPVLINRDNTYSGIPQYRMTNQPHREFIYRAAYEMGRHIIGYEIQKVLALVDWLEKAEPTRKTAVMGYGEGGLLSFYAASVDPRIDIVVVSGYFQPRDALWQEPIYRNVWSLLTEFGDAEIASLIVPRPLIVEHCDFPHVDGPPQSPERRGAAPGRISTPSIDEVKAEVERANRRVKELADKSIMHLVESESSQPGDDKTLRLMLQYLAPNRELKSPDSHPIATKLIIDSEVRQKRQFDQLLEHTQRLMRESEFRREEFWEKANNESVESWVKSSQWYRGYLWDEIIGKLPPATVPMNARTRLVYDEPLYTGYEVVLDVYPDVFSYGILLLPKGIQPGEKRPVVVCQHGLEGRPQNLADPAIDHRAYHQYACKLAERGFITFSPQNPYIGEDNFRVLLRKGQPLKITLYSFIARQHERILDWLKQLESVDPDRIAFYGLSYGGKTAMRIPALLDDYCLSICSADYNEWIWKNVSARHKYSYLITGEYDMPEFNLGDTFNYAELSWLIFPRPFMVERGHHDGVAPDEWVAYEYARTRRHYNLLGFGDRTEIEFFNGPHTINGVGTFKFLHKHLRWPENR